MFLDDLSLEGAISQLDFRTFLIDMNALFETFVAKSIVRHLPLPLTVQAQARRTLNIARHVRMSIDLLISHRGVPTLVADTKYKRVATHGQSTADICQMLAYCVVTSVPIPVLIYPQEQAGSLTEPPTLAIRHTNITVHSIAIDLSKPASGLMAEMDRLTD